MKVVENISQETMEKMSTNRDLSNSSTLYELDFVSIEGEITPLSQFRGKFLLLVNVASQCGFTKQYKALQELSDLYGDQLVVIGFPCNQFGNQEPGDAGSIKSFCERRFGVSFPLSQKIDVKGSQQHPIYKWLTTKELNGKKNSKVHWNFQKYLINPDGKLIDVFYSITSPLSKKITRNFQ